MGGKITAQVGWEPATSRSGSGSLTTLDTPPRLHARHTLSPSLQQSTLLVISEADCSDPQAFQCADNSTCVWRLLRCDGRSHCPDRSDEWPILDCGQQPFPPPHTHTLPLRFIRSSHNYQLIMRSMLHFGGVCVYLHTTSRSVFCYKNNT